jgi:hypothetical protein
VYLVFKIPSSTVLEKSPVGDNDVDAISDAEKPISQRISERAIYPVDERRINYAELVPHAYGKERTAAE